MMINLKDVDYYAITTIGKIILHPLLKLINT